MRRSTPPPTLRQTIRQLLPQRASRSLPPFQTPHKSRSTPKKSNNDDIIRIKQENYKLNQQCHSQQKSIRLLQQRINELKGNNNQSAETSDQDFNIRSDSKNYPSLPTPAGNPSQVLNQNKSSNPPDPEPDNPWLRKDRNIAKLSTPPVLAFPDFTKEFHLVTDACNIGIGSCLMQEYEGKRRPIAFYSRKFRASEVNYSTTDKESIAIVDSLKRFRYIIYNYPVIVHTDHAACKELFKNPNISGKRARWYLTCQDYDIEIKHIQGKLNTVADSLSRYPVDFESINTVVASEKENTYTLTPVNLSLEEGTVLEQQRKDQDLVPIINFLKDKHNEIYRNINLNTHFKIPVHDLELVDNLLVRKTKYDFKDMMPSDLVQIVTPSSLIPLVLKATHDSRGHPGRDETLRQVRLKYFWKTLVKDVHSYVQECNQCAIHKGTVSGPHPLGTYPIPQTPFQRVHIDLITNFHESTVGFKHILVCVDSLTRYTELIPLRSKTGKECASAFHDRILCRYSCPDILLSDNGTEFQNAFFTTLCEFFAIRKVNILPYMPQSNGLVERVNRKLLDLMRQIVNPNDDNWHTKLPSIQCILNTSIHSSIKQSPHVALYGYQPRLPYESLRSRIQKSYTDDPIHARINNAKRMFQELGKNLEIAQVVMKQNHQRLEKDANLKSGDLVHIKEDVRSGPNYKLKQKFSGPFVILEEKHGNKILVRSVENPEQTRITHKDKVKLYKRGTVTENTNNQQEQDTGNLSQSQTVSSIQHNSTTNNDCISNSPLSTHHIQRKSNVAYFELEDTLITAVPGTRYQATHWVYANSKVVKYLKNLHLSGYTIILFSTGRLFNRDAGSDYITEVIRDLGIPLTVISVGITPKFMNNGLTLADYITQNTIDRDTVDVENSFYIGKNIGEESSFSTCKVYLENKLAIRFCTPEEFFGDCGNNPTKSVRFSSKTIVRAFNDDDTLSELASRGIDEIRIEIPL